MIQTTPRHVAYHLPEMITDISPTRFGDLPESIFRGVWLEKTRLFSMFSLVFLFDYTHPGKQFLEYAHLHGKHAVFP